MSTPAVELRGVTKDFLIGLRGLRLRAVDNLTLQVSQGEIFGLLGPNGCGKSTTIKIVLGFLLPTSGQCSVFGISSDRVESRMSIGYLPESPDFYRYLSGKELVKFYAQLCGLSGAFLFRRVAEVIEAVGLTFAANRRVGTYSKGMLQRIGLAQAIVHDPKLVILDEPTAGVDPMTAASISELLLALKAQGKTIIITSHLLGQLDELCDRVAILEGGRLLLEGRVSELSERGKTPSLQLDELSSADRAELDRWLVMRGYPVSRVNRSRVGLEQVFLEQVGADPSRTFL